QKDQLWVTTPAGLWRWMPGPPTFMPMPNSPMDIVEDEQGVLLVATGDGIKQFINGRAEPYPVSGAGRQIKPSRVFRDRDGGLWLGTSDGGLLHVGQGRTDRFATAEGLSGNFVGRVFEDREGNIWVATSGGLDRFREVAAATVPLGQALSTWA